MALVRLEKCLEPCVNIFNLMHFWTWRIGKIEIEYLCVHQRREKYG